MNEQNDIYLYGLVDETVVDGEGIRMAVFVQGCPHRCEGCHNPKSHPFEGGELTTVDNLISKYLQNPLLDGFTFSGGEPFCQAAALANLARRVHALNGNVWCYSGYTFDELISHSGDSVRDLLDNIDVLIDGRFEIAQRDLKLKFRGSANQRILNVKKSLEQKSPVLYYNN